MPPWQADTGAVLPDLVVDTPVAATPSAHRSDWPENVQAIHRRDGKAAAVKQRQVSTNRDDCRHGDGGAEGNAKRREANS